VAVHVRGRADVRVAEDPLHRDRAGAEHHQQRRGGVARVVEPERRHLTDRPELEVALGAATQVSVGRLLAVAAARAATLMHVAGHDLRAPEGRPEHVHEHHVLRVLAAVGTREDPLGWRRVDGFPQVRAQLVGDGDAIFMAAFRDL
jgi:hypothetical protein